MYLTTIATDRDISFEKLNWMICLQLLRIFRTIHLDVELNVAGF